MICDINVTFFFPALPWMAVRVMLTTLFTCYIENLVTMCSPLCECVFTPKRTYACVILVSMHGSPLTLGYWRNHPFLLLVNLCCMYQASTYCDMYWHLDCCFLFYAFVACLTLYHRSFLSKGCSQLQFNAQSSSMSPQLGIGLNIQSSVLSSVTSTQLQNPIHQLSSQTPLIFTGPKDVGKFIFPSLTVWLPSDVRLFIYIFKYAVIGHSKGEELQQQQNLSDDMNTSTQSSDLNKFNSDDNLKTSPLV